LSDSRGGRVTPVAPHLHGELLRVSRAVRLLVACDFDGTLAPLVDDPTAARAIPAALEALRQLDVTPATTVALVSGRSREDLRRVIVPTDSMLLVGSHGAEIADRRPRVHAPMSLEVLESISATVASIDDAVRVEMKPFGIACHLRSVDERRRDQVGRIIERTLRATDGLTIRQGKAVIEASLVDTTKGDALVELRQTVSRVRKIV